MLTGVNVALVTPFKKGKIDEKSLKKLIEFQIQNGITSIVSCSTTGENSTLSYKEYIQVIKITIDVVNKRVPVVIGTGTNNTMETIELTNLAYKAGADVVLIVCPYYNIPTQEGIYQHYKHIAKSVNIPILLYNIPNRTGINMLPNTILKLSKIKNIIGIKESSEIKQMNQILSLINKNFLVLSGDDFLTYPLLCMGGHGVISVVANIIPKDLVLMVNTFLKGNFLKSRELYVKMLSLIESIFIKTNPIPIKSALFMMNKITDEIRLPLIKLTGINKIKLKKELIKYGIL